MTATEELTGRVIAVTGASRGIGRAVVTSLAGRGATVVLFARDPERLRVVAEEIGDRAVPVPMDVGDPDSVRRAMTTVEQRCGRLDVLVNNAAVGWPHRIEDATDEELRTEIDTNVLGPIYATRAAVPLLRRSADPHLINVSSESVEDPFPYLVVYSATKAALENLTLGLRRELQGDGIRVTLLRIGLTEGGEFRMHWPDERRAEAEQQWHDLGFKARVSGGVVGQSPERVAEAIAYVVTRPPGSFVEALTVRAQPGRA